MSSTPKRPKPSLSEQKWMSALRAEDAGVPGTPQRNSSDYRSSTFPLRQVSTISGGVESIVVDSPAGVGPRPPRERSSFIVEDADSPSSLELAVRLQDLAGALREQVERAEQRQRDSARQLSMYAALVKRQQQLIARLKSSLRDCGRTDLATDNALLTPEQRHTTGYATATTSTPPTTLELDQAIATLYTRYNDIPQYTSPLPTWSPRTVNLVRQLMMTTGARGSEVLTSSAPFTPGASTHDNIPENAALHANSGSAKKPFVSTSVHQVSPPPTERSTPSAKQAAGAPPPAVAQGGLRSPPSSHRSSSSSAVELGATHPAGAAEPTAEAHQTSPLENPADVLADIRRRYGI